MFTSEYNMTMSHTWRSRGAGEGGGFWERTTFPCLYVCHFTLSAMNAVATSTRGLDTASSLSFAISKAEK